MLNVLKLLLGFLFNFLLIFYYWKKYRQNKKMPIMAFGMLAFGVFVLFMYVLN